MGIVRFPHDLVHANQVAQLNTCFFIPEVNIDLTPEKLARARQYPFCPEMPALPFVIAGLQNVMHPSEAGLSAYPVKVGIAIENA